MRGRGIKAGNMSMEDVWRTPTPSNSGIIGICQDPNITVLIPKSHYYWMGASP